MSDAFPISAELSQEIERLRSGASDTRGLYREVCVLLFFRHGITPTANRLYHLVRKGSMSVPTSVLREFWADLREKSRVRIEHPDLPEDLRTHAGELLATLWNEAQAAAGEALSVLREQAVESSRLAEAAGRDAEARAERWRETAERTQQQLAATHEHLIELERQLASERTASQSLRGQLEAALRQNAQLENSLDDARQDFASELEKQRQALERSEERLLANERRALLEIDHERTRAGRLQIALEKTREDAAIAMEAQQAQWMASQQRIAELSLRLGEAEGALASNRERILRYEPALESLEKQFHDAERSLARALEAIESRDSTIESLEKQLANVRPSTPREARRRRESLLRKNDSRG